MFKVKGTQKGRPKNDVKHSAWFQSLFNFLSYQNDILPEVKLNVNNSEMRNVLKCKHRFCLNYLAACFLSEKNEVESQCPAFKINTFKADISPSSDLLTLLSLVKIQCSTCSKM